MIDIISLIQSILWINYALLSVLFVYLIFEFVIITKFNHDLFTKLTFSRTDCWDFLSAFLSLFGLSSIFTNLIFLGLPNYAFAYFADLKLSLFDGVSAPFKIFIAIVVYDFLSYWRHRFFHSTAITWQAHLFHHSSTRMTALTDLRQHPLQGFFARLIVSVPLQILFGFRLEDTLIFTMVNGFMGFFTHGRIDTGLGWVGKYLLVTPRYHYLHHSIRGTQHKNYGDMFVIWDRLFGTYYEPSQSIYQLKVGITNNYFETSAIWSAYFLPIINFYKNIFLLFKSRTSF